MNACIRSVCKALSIVLKEDAETLNVLCLRLIQITIGKKGAQNVQFEVQLEIGCGLHVLCLSRAVSSLQDYPIQQYPNVILDSGIHRL